MTVYASKVYQKLKACLAVEGGRLSTGPARGSSGEIQFPRQVAAGQTGQATEGCSYGTATVFDSDGALRNCSMERRRGAR